MIGNNEGGNERYTKNLATHLVKHEKGKTNNFVLIDHSYFKNIPGKINRDLYRLFYFIPNLVNKLHLDVVHSNYIAPFYKNCKSVITVHDFSFKYYPKFYSLKEKVIFNILLPYSLYQADAIIVPSQFTKKEAIKFYPQYQNKIYVTYEAADDRFFTIGKKTAEKLLYRKYNFLKNFLLTINSSNPKKNINAVIEAFLSLKEKSSGLKLVIVGGDFNIKGPYKNRDDLVILNYIKDDYLNLLYNTCRIFIYYSLYEGFGLPILEAIKCGAAVIASDIKVHREITRNKIIYADLDNSQDLRNKITILLKDQNKTNNIKEESAKVDKLYSWDNTAKQTQEIYKLLLNNETSNHRH